MMLKMRSHSMRRRIMIMTAVSNHCEICHVFYYLCFMYPIGVSEINCLAWITFSLCHITMVMATMMKRSCDDDDGGGCGGGGGGDDDDNDDGDDDAGASAAVIQWRDGPDDQRWTEGTAKTAHEKGTTLQEWPAGWSVVGLSVCLLTCFVLVVVLLVMQSHM